MGFRQNTRFDKRWLSLHNQRVYLHAVQAPTTPIQAQIAALSERGDHLAEGGNFNAAVARYEEALALLPPHQRRGPSASWLHAAIGDACFLKGSFEASRQNMLAAYGMPGGPDNPFVRLRLGQASLELKDEEAAFEHLMMAFRIGGEKLFFSDDPKYFRWLMDKV